MDLRSIQEAKVAANQALALLVQVEKQLKSARNWGFYDLLGGGFLVSLIKHRRVDKADTLLQQVRAKLRQLQKELADVTMDLDPDIEITSFERFMDIALDNIISDWIVQSEIRSSLDQVAQVKADVQDVLSTLDRLE